MANIQFITSNPAQDAFDRRAEQQARQQAREFEMDRAQQELMQQRQVDEAMRSGIQQAGSADPVISSLVATPGGGEIAMRRFGQLEDQTDAWEEAALNALGRGELDVYQHYSQKAGLNLPPEIVQNAETRSLLSSGALLAKEFYRDDPAQAQRFVSAYIQSRGDPRAAWAAAGAPRRAGGRPSYSIETIMNGDQRIRARINRDTGEVTPLTFNGEPVIAPGGVGGGGSQTAREIEYEQYRRAYPDASEAEILRMMDSRATDPAQNRRFALDIARNTKDSEGFPVYTTEAEILAAAERIQDWIEANSAMPGVNQGGPQPEAIDGGSVERMVEDIRSQYQSGLITYDEAARQLRTLGFEE
jgi:hypothetical protein